MIDRHAMLCDFIAAVADMRAHQRTFYKAEHYTDKRTRALHASLVAERKVDRLLEQLLPALAPQQGLDL